YWKKNEKRMNELQEEILKRRQVGRVMVLADANGWIGNRPSVVEREGKEEFFERKTTREETNPQGEWFVSNMNSMNMIIVNGVREIAQPTFRHTGRDAESVIDYVVVDEETMKEGKGIEYRPSRGVGNRPHPPHDRHPEYREVETGTQNEEDTRTEK